MTALLDALRRQIASDGPLPVDRYMAIALGHPRHGYYTTRDPLGAAGDFTTAPEISQVFGELIGIWLAHCWERIGRPVPVRLVELGPGRGTLMRDLLRAARVMPGFAAAAELHLVETSPVLRARQADTLEAVADATWHDRLADVPDGPTLAVANEFFDALPVRQFQRTAEGWRERLIGWDAGAGALCFALAPDPVPDPAIGLLPAAATAGDCPPGTVAEFCPSGIAVAANLAGRIAEAGGAALIIDYGYAAPASGDTLQAVRRHRHADPLAEPGEADLTAHVDFSALAVAARDAGARVLGPVSQRDWLGRMGIAERASILKRQASGRQSAEIDAAVHRLTAPELMGELFRIMAIAAAALVPAPGFVAQGGSVDR